MHQTIFTQGRRLCCLALSVLLLLTSGCASAPAPEPAEIPTEVPQETLIFHYGSDDQIAPASPQACVLEAVYPASAPYPNESAFWDSQTGEFDDEGYSAVYSAWREDQQSRRNQPEGYADNLRSFFSLGIPVFLSGEADNPVCSPLNIYMALAMLAETTDASSRQQILDALGSGDLTALRTKAGQVWNAHYLADGSSATVLANSLWLRDGLIYKEETIQTLAGNYFASVFQGPLGSPEMNQALQDWINLQTQGLLKEHVGQLQMDPNTVLALASTVYYRAKWRNEFHEESNTEGPFHAPDGEQTVTFMNRTISSGTYYWGEDFGATALPLEDGSAMWLILPDEGKTPADLLASGHALDMILTGIPDYENQKRLQVHLSLPKFDISADMQLQSPLAALGITDVFQEGVADFTPILPETPAWLDAAEHAARVAIDEEGVTAAAYTVMMAVGNAMPPAEEVYLTFDRPFLFVISSHDNLPLFAGIVNTP